MGSEAKITASPSADTDSSRTDLTYFSKDLTFLTLQKLSCFRAFPVIVIMLRKVS